VKNSILVVLVLINIFSSVVALGASVKEEIFQMEKVDARHYVPPLPIALIGSKSGDQVNFMTCAWFTRLETNPCLFGISIQKRHFTHQAIMENKCFSINIPPVDFIPRVDAVGMLSGKEYDKSQVFDVFYGDNENSPMVYGSIFSFECEVVNSVSLVEAGEAHPNAHTLFIGEVKNVWVNKKAVKGNTLDFKTMEPIIWATPPSSYYTIGENKGRAFNQDNKKLVPKKK
jgi:flavin reductase (DIM6/NTAB) family NADH-FMN oxidoreductase RutF